jgi:hypothetical protein
MIRRQDRIGTRQVSGLTELVSVWDEKATAAASTYTLDWRSHG